MEAAGDHCRNDQCFTTHKSVGLSAEIQDRLLLDLEDYPCASLLRICKFRPEYGAARSILRKSVQNKVHWYKNLKHRDIAKYNRLLKVARNNQFRRSSEESLALVEAPSDPPNKTDFDITMRSWASTPQKLQKVSAATTLVAKKDTHQGLLGSPALYGSPSASSTSSFSKQKDPSELFASYEEAEAYGMWCPRIQSILVYCLRFLTSCYSTGAVPCLCWCKLMMSFILILTVQRTTESFLSIVSTKFVTQAERN